MCVIHSGEKNERCPNVLTLDDIYDGWTQHLEGQARVAAWELHKKPCENIRKWNVPGHEAYVLQTSELEMHRKSDLTPEEKETIR